MKIKDIQTVRLNVNDMHRYIIFLFLLYIGSNVYAQVLIDSIVAVVNTEAITHSELENEFQIAAIVGKPILEPSKRAVLETIINRKFVLQESERIGVVIAERDDRIAGQITEIRTRFASTTDFKNALQQHQLETETLRMWVYEQLIYDEFFRRRFFNAVSSAEVERLAKSYYETNKTEFTDSERQKEYSEVREEITERVRQAQAEQGFEVWLNRQKEEGTWHILDDELTQAGNEAR